jgi:hypothetical protein
VAGRNAELLITAMIIKFTSKNKEVPADDIYINNIPHASTVSCSFLRKTLFLMVRFEVKILINILICMPIRILQFKKGLLTEEMPPTHQ